MRDISVIVPIYNESSNIDKLRSLNAFLGCDCEMLFVDGGSSDDTVALLENEGIMVIKAPEKGRANQMNYGASIASGDILWFVHSDSIIPADPVSMIRRVLAKGSKIGCFRLRFDSKSLLMHLTAWLSNLRVKTRGIAFGDQGIFIKKDLFTEIGGYAPIPLMEDYRLSLDVKQAGYKIGIARGKIITSERRYLKGGRWKTIRMMWSLQKQFRRGNDIEEIARRYEAGG